MTDVEVRAAGGVIWRDHSRLEIVVIHRPKYHDWSFPKGKNEPGETDEECALREVAEETGLRCELGAELATVRYLDRNGRKKQIRYWAMQSVGAAKDWDDEVDVLCWLPLDEAAHRLSYERDAAVLESFRKLAAQSD